MKVGKIVQAYKDVAFHSEEEQRCSELRLNICKTCSHREGSVVHYCNVCHCLLKPKSYTRESNACPLKLWKEL